MAWSISMSDQGWRNVHQNLVLMNEEWLKDAIVDDRIEAWCETHTKLPSDRTIKSWYNSMRYWHIRTLAKECMALIRQHNTCDNGGHQVWIDREGYRTVPVTYQGDDADADGNYPIEFW